MIRFYLKKMYAIYKKYTPCQGIFLRVKGKIAVGGNSRKRSFIVKIGTFTFTSKKIKLEYTQFYLLTETGILGVKLIFSFI